MSLEKEDRMVLLAPLALLESRADLVKMDGLEDLVCQAPRYVTSGITNYNSLLFYTVKLL